MLMTKHRGPLSADLHQHHGIRLALGRRCGYSIFELADFAANLPIGSAVSRATDPDWAITPDSLMLREIEHGVRVLAWTKTDDARSRNPQHYPEPLPVTQAEIKARRHETPMYDVMTIDEANQFLGWPDGIPA